MTTYLLRANERGEILDASGKVVGRVVPVEPTHFGTQFYVPVPDLSAVAVRVPERKHYPDINGNNGWAQWNACLDALGVKP